MPDGLLGFGELEGLLRRLQAYGASFDAAQVSPRTKEQRIVHSVFDPKPLRYFDVDHDDGHSHMQVER